MHWSNRNVTLQAAETNSRVNHSQIPPAPPPILPGVASIDHPLHPPHPSPDLPAEKRSLRPATHFARLRVACLNVRGEEGALKWPNARPAGCDFWGFPSKMPPGSCGGSAWPSLCTQTAPSSSSWPARDWSGLCPGESEISRATIKATCRATPLIYSLINSNDISFLIRKLSSCSRHMGEPAVELPWSDHTCDAVAGCSAGRFLGGSGFPPEKDDKKRIWLL